MKTYDEIKKDVEELRWFHNFEIVPDLMTQGVDLTLIKLEALHMPENLKGMNVLDIGAYDGFFSFECEKRGAEVTATDRAMWEASGSDASKCFDYVHKLYKSKVKKVVCSVEELDPNKLGTFDIVLFLGVLYHGDSPFLYLKNAANMCGDFLLIETFVDCLDIDRPVGAFYSGARTVNKDPSTRFGFNILAIRDMLSELGFARVVEYPLWDIDTGMKLSNPEICPPGSTGRVVIHAWRK